MEKKKDLTDILKDLQKTDTEKETKTVVPTKTYSKIRDSMETGDIIAFAGEGKFSTVIKGVTGKCKNNHSISHVAMVLRTTAHSSGLVQLMESTSLGDGFAGVQITRMSTHIKNYKGKIWWYPIKRDIQIRLKPMLQWLLAQEGKPYDLPQAILSALDFVYQQEDFDKLFCSELCAEALERGGVINSVIASRITPVELIDNYFDKFEVPSFITRE